MTEQLPYEVVRAFPRFDVRRYPACVLVQVRVGTDAARAAAVGFRQLHRYLSGVNETGTTFTGTTLDGTAFDGTASLLQEPAGEYEQLVSVILPADTDPATVPPPLDESLRIRAVPVHEAAALRFGGGWSGKRLGKQGRVLLDQVSAVRLEPTGSVYFARLDPSWKPGFLTRNEALVRVTSA